MMPVFINDMISNRYFTIGIHPAACHDDDATCG